MRSFISSTAVLVCEITRIPLLSFRGKYFSKIISLASKAVVFPLPGTACKSNVEKSLINSNLSLSKF
jgi:hypothetical protein